MTVMGIDPGIHITGIAVTDETTCYAVDVVSISKELKKEDAVRKMILELQKEIFYFIELLDMNRISLPKLIVVESQEIYPGKNKCKYEDLINLSKVAGAAAGVVLNLLNLPKFSSLRIPKPFEWKGDRPKPLHQSNILKRMGWKCRKTSTHAYPIEPLLEDRVLNAENISNAEWKEVVDAIGLAMWGAQLKDWQKEL